MESHRGPRSRSRAFFLPGLGGPPETTPTVSFSGDADAEYVLTHEGGDGLDATNVSVLRNDEDVGTWAELAPTMEADDEVSAGHQVVVRGVEEDDTIAVVWHGEATSATMCRGRSRAASNAHGHADGDGDGDAAATVEANEDRPNRDGKREDSVVTSRPTAFRNHRGDDRSGPSGEGGTGKPSPSGSLD